MIKKFFRENPKTAKYYKKVRDIWKAYWINKIGLKEISKVTIQANQENLITFADFGTLLGIVRENSLLKHDTDIDVGVIAFDSNVQSQINDLFIRNNYKKTREFIIDNKIAEQSYEKSRIKIDIQYYYPYDKDNMFCYLFYRENMDNKKYCNSVKKVCPIVSKVKKTLVKGYEIYIPDNAEQLLEYKYGDNWKSPDKTWVYWEGPNTYKISTLGEFIDFQ